MFCARFTLAGSYDFIRNPAPIELARLWTDALLINETGNPSRVKGGVFAQHFKIRLGIRIPPGDG